MRIRWSAPAGRIRRGSFTKSRNGRPSREPRLPAQRIAILGSTGSIGCNALEVIDSLAGDGYRAVALSAHRQGDKLLEQVRRYRPAAVALTCDEPDEALCKEV